MNEKQYITALNDIIQNVNENNAEQMIQKLEQLYKWKPVRTKWYAAKVIALFQKECLPNKIYDITKDKVCTLYDIDGVTDILQTYQKLALNHNDILNSRRNEYILSSLSMWFGISNNEQEKFLKGKRNFLKTIYQKFISHDESEENIINIINNCYVQQNFVTFMIFDELYQKLFHKKSRVYQWVRSFANTGELYERLNDSSDTAFMVVATDENDILECRAIANVLSKLGKRVYLFDLPIQFSVDNPVELKDTAIVSLENMEIQNNLKVIHPIELIYQDESLGWNTDYILDTLHQNDLKNEHSLLISSGFMIDQLCQSETLRKQMGRLYHFQTEYLESNMSFAWIGSYIDYIKTLYHMDVLAMLQSPSKCKFSIVIPARNSADTLRYTIKTCLEQSYQHDFEILISDNSTENQTEIYELYKEFDDPKITYIRTPRNLSLSKSFEFAYLHAKGEYIFAIGSDDGLLPWALEVLDHIISQYPSEEIIQWERGFYAWPGFNDGQQHQFVIPRQYEKGEYGCYYRSKVNYLASILNNPNAMYLLPMLYINSCFKRTYFETLLEKTGRLWDGICQDIYMGVITASIHNQILNLTYPLSIAGMSNASIGAKSKQATVTNEELQKVMENIRLEANIGGYCPCSMERLVANMGTDTNSLYVTLLKAVAIGVLPDNYLTEVFDFKQIFEKLIMELDIRDVAIDRKMQEFRYAAMLHGEEFLQWFDENLYSSYVVPRQIPKTKKQDKTITRTYQEGKTKEGGLVLDASKYNVINIYDAVKLFQKLTNL